MFPSVISDLSKAIWMGVAFVFCAISVINAQTPKTNDYAKSDYFSNFNPGTPEKSALGSFGNTPINYFTGLPEINLNLVTLPSRSISVPVSLSYDATGVKLDDISGPVGLKWNLNAGGYVARQMNGGYPDEHNTNGYWKFSAELNAGSINGTGWTQNSEQMTRDAEPDEFFVYVPGNTFRFIFKDGVATCIPRTDAQITYTLSNNKINGFQIIDAAGTIYSFGTDVNAIEERRVDNLTMVANFSYDWRADEYTYKEGSVTKTGTYAWFYIGDNLKINYAEFQDKTHGWVNSKWYLTSIKSADGDVITFSYSKQGTTSYVTQPVVTRKMPLLTKVNNYQYDDNVCVEFSETLGVTICTDHRDRHITHNEWMTPAYAAFSNSCPDYLNCSYVPPFVEQAQSNLYLDPKARKIDPEGIFLNQARIYESVIRLDAITGATGHKVKFFYSDRADLPSSFKCDSVALVNLNNGSVKLFRFKYTTVSALKDSKDYMWLSEAIMVNTMPPTIGNIYANSMHSSNEANVGDVILRKYAFEGTKPYNYQRLFLDEIVEASYQGSPDQQKMYAFKYDDRANLRRRITPMQTISGFTRDGVTAEEMQFGHAKVNMTNAYDPSAYREPVSNSITRGLLTELTYPTGGRTSFAFSGTRSPRLTSISDYDELGKPVKERAIQYMESSSIGADEPVMTSFQNSQDPGTGLYAKYKITSSVPQNRSFRTFNGVYLCNTRVRVYNGKSSTVHNGFEEFVYSLTKDGVVSVYSNPKDIDNVTGQALDFLNTSEVFPFPRTNQRDHLSGMPKEHTVYDKDGRKIKSTVNSYVVNPNGYAAPTVLGFIGGSFKNGTGNKFRYGRYSISCDWVVLGKTTEYLYDQSANYDPNKYLMTETVFSFNGSDFYPAGKSVNTPAGSVYTSYKYASHPDYDFSYAGITPTTEVLAIIKLRTSHRNSVVIEEQKQTMGSTGLVVTSAVVKTFKVYASGNFSFAEPDKVYACNSTGLDPRVLKTSKTNADGTLFIPGSLRLVHTYNSYDANGNILQQTAFDGTTIKYNWHSTLNLVTEQILNEGVQEQKTTYVHKALVGVSTIKDPNGIKKSFEYDDFERLEFLRDNSDNVLTKYRYHLASGNNSESITASIAVSGAVAVNSTVRFSTPIESRPYGMTYVWDFGDGTQLTRTSPYVDKVYSVNGIRTVKLTKIHPEFGTAYAETTIIVAPPVQALQVSICADGPVRADVCRLTTGADGYGTCTASGNNKYSYKTKLKITTTGGCSSSLSYQWQCKISGASTWINFGTNSSEVVSPYLPPAVVTGDVRCIVTDACGIPVTSAPIFLLFFKSNATCTPVNP